MRKQLFFFLLLFAIVFLTGCKPSNNVTGSVTITQQSATEQTFRDTGDEICRNAEGKPIIRLYSTSWCPHCEWVKDTYTTVVTDYLRRGEIEAHNWVLDLDTDDLDPAQKSIPAKEYAVLNKYNAQQSIPTFVLGCKYLRIGNGYEAQNDLGAEGRELRRLIDQLLAAA